ncbi:SDR family NAD(P)-dependent oxidoreductase [Tistrella bauzanensis]
MQAPYTAAKFAVTGFTEALRTELIHARSRIHLAIVHPPATNTPFFAHAGSRMEGGVPGRCRRSMNPRWLPPPFMTR